MHSSQRRSGRRSTSSTSVRQRWLTNKQNYAVRPFRKLQREHGSPASRHFVRTGVDHHFRDLSISPSQKKAGQGYLSDEEAPLTPREYRQIGIGQNETEPVEEEPAASEAAEAPVEAPAEAPGEAPPAETEATEEAAAEATPAPACAIASRTAVHAPDGTPDTRTRIGVCETVGFSMGGRAVNWMANTGWPRARNSRANFNWAAPERPGTSTITATDPASGQTCALDMTVVAPSNIRMRRNSVLGGYAAGTAGAGMTAIVRVYPRNVNFGWVSIKEDPGPASNVTGYFANLQASGSNLSHVPNPNFTRLGWNNNVCCDTAATVAGTLPAPWAPGTWDWRIPTRYRCSYSTGAGRIFTRTLQQFRINAAGRVTVRKQGASVSRSP